MFKRASRRDFFFWVSGAGSAFSGRRCATKKMVPPPAGRSNLQPFLGSHWISKPDLSLISVVVNPTPQSQADSVRLSSGTSPQEGVWRWRSLVLLSLQCLPPQADDGERPAIFCLFCFFPRSPGVGERKPS